MKPIYPITYYLSLILVLGQFTPSITYCDALSRRDGVVSYGRRCDCHSCPTNDGDGSSSSTHNIGRNNKQQPTLKTTPQTVAIPSPTSTLATASITNVNKDKFTNTNNTNDGARHNHSSNNDTHDNINSAIINTNEHHK